MRKLTTKEKKIALVFLTCLPVLGYISHLQNKVKEYKQEALNRKETLDMVMIERGATRSQQDVLAQKDLDKLAKDLSEDLNQLKKELKKGQIESVTQIRLSLETEGATVDVEEPEFNHRPEIEPSWDAFGKWVPNSTMWVRDEWVHIQIRVPNFEVLQTEHAPIELSVIDHAGDDGRAQYVVAKNGWSGELIDRVEVSRSVVQKDVFDPYFSIGVGFHDQSVYTSLSRHNSATRFWQGSIGYNMADKGLVFGLGYSMALKWPF